MGAQLRVVRRRIRSVQSTKKITRAMELIASSRIVKAQQRVEASRPYAQKLTAAMEDLAPHPAPAAVPADRARGGHRRGRSRDRPRRVPVRARTGEDPGSPVAAVRR